MGAAPERRHQLRSRSVPPWAPTRTLALRERTGVRLGGEGRAITEGVKGFDRQALVRLRRARGLSHDALGERIDRPRPNIIKWEQGETTPSPEKLVVLARALGVEPWHLTSTRPASAELADLRDWAGMTRRDLAATAGLTREAYSLLERGRAPLSDEVATALAGALGREVAEIRRAYRRTVRRVRAEDPSSAATRKSG